MGGQSKARQSGFQLAPAHTPHVHAPAPGRLTLLTLHRPKLVVPGSPQPQGPRIHPLTLNRAATMIVNIQGGDHFQSNLRPQMSHRKHIYYV